MKNEDEHIMLITDGGPENSLKEYVETIDANVIHRRALIDVQCSNSLIEAHNKPTNNKKAVGLPGEYIYVEQEYLRRIEELETKTRLT